jgi:hypothetical protein
MHKYTRLINAGIYRIDADILDYVHNVNSSLCYEENKTKEVSSSRKLYIKGESMSAVHLRHARMPKCYKWKYTVIELI